MQITRKNFLAAISTAFSSILLLTTVATAAVPDDYDVTGDSVINMSDVILLNRFIAEDVECKGLIYNWDITQDGILTIEDTVMLLNFLRDNGNVTLTTDTTTSTTTDITTTSISSTTETTETVSSTTTVSTPVDTTTATTSTTSTTTSTTTTTTTNTNTTTSTTTTSTSSTPSQSEVREAANEYMAQLLREASEGIEIPPLNDTSYRRGSGVFFAKYGSKVFAFTMLTKNPDAPEFFEFSENYIDAIHCWEYTQGNIDFSLPDTSEAFFINEDGEKCTYRLEETLKCSQIWRYNYDYVNFLMTGNAIDIQTILYIDYNLDGQISPEDIKETFKRYDLIYFKRMYSEWLSFFTNLWESELPTSNWNTANFVLEYSSDYTDYSLVSPVSSDGSFSGLTQVLPINLYDSLLEEFGEPWFERSDEDDCIFFDSCDSAYDGMIPCWTTANSSMIQFAHIKLIDENGDFISHRLDNYGH